MTSEQQLINAYDLWTDVMMLPHNGDMISSEEVEQLIKYVATVGVAEVVHAQWQKQWCDNSMIGHEYEECPICSCMILDTEKFWDCNFCPNCGAKMDGKSNVPREN